MQGKIVKGIAGFYYVNVDGKIYECKAKGVFRKDHRKPLVGDDVRLEILDEEKKLGNVAELLPRKSELIRPAVANVDQAMVIFAVTSPAPNLNLLDRFLIMMDRQKLPCLICFNKVDLGDAALIENYRKTYENSGHPMLFISAKNGLGLEDLKVYLQGKTTTVAGPSGVGKSSLINLLLGESTMETGSLSAKIDRGKHTTRHSELLQIGPESFIFDTPGFSSLEVTDVEKEELAGYYAEFDPFEKYCRFGGCSHVTEPICGIRQAVRDGEISHIRYENYCQLYEELKAKKRY
ncbi:MAG: ribosome small subunit-dependent GTPase A [Lachnospiraceae bacterium]|nr:ribosome small subunit-dependent GTPase A [Lachnospiraceae bacterium]MBR4606215.1 ribosome small subunit-dependent GTPase A [Lachnospiraceae bacterium]MBR6152668.1 ribosome small subunit-dependent GTPase A [Lachnospiraceae bacterium]